jgi:hypothetical protein
MEEGKVFWMETMEPHLDLIARSFDPISDEYFVDFDTTGVPIIILSQQEQSQFHLQEYQQGLISVNEYRTLTGRKKVEADLADSILANPNLTPIANTEKPMEDPNAAAGANPMAGAAGPAGPAGPAGAAGPAGPAGPEGAPAAPEGPIPAGTEPIPAGGIQAGVPIAGQGAEATQTVATEFSPEEGGFVPLGTVEGTRDIELPASQVPSIEDGLELEEEDEEEGGEKSLPLPSKPLF